MKNNVNLSMPKLLSPRVFDWKGGEPRIRGYWINVVSEQGYLRELSKILITRNNQRKGEGK
jgi:hypothetical protein